MDTAGPNPTGTKSSTMVMDKGKSETSINGLRLPKREVQVSDRCPTTGSVTASHNKAIIEIVPPSAADKPAASVQIF